MQRCAVFIAVFFLMIFAVPACQTAPSAGSGAPNMNSLAGEWVLERIAGDEMSGLLPAGMRRPSLLFRDDGSVTGFGGVNQLGSRLDLAKFDKGEFSLGPIISTKMAGPPEAMNIEGRFTSSLERASEVRIGGDALTLSDGSGALLRFRRN